MEQTVVYKTSKEWFTENWVKLADFGGEWVAFDETGVKYHDADLHIVVQKMDKNQEDLTLHFEHRPGYRLPTCFRFINN